ncbi:MAG: hypothetical protein QNJ54_10740 [Prochloraceae cyanobacterium]|nr:hypothetical protein [Prochloraceae cyanobacterium]
MSDHKKNILDFIEVLENQPSLLTPDDSLDLQKLLKTLPDDIKEFSNQITSWYYQRQTIKNAIFALPEDPTERNPRKRKSNITTEEAKELIENVVRQSKKSSESSQTSDRQPQQ